MGAFTRPSTPRPFAASAMDEKPSALTKRLIREGCAARAARTYGDGPVRLMAQAEGFVMVRRANGQPFVITEADWDRLQVHQAAAE